MPLFQCRHHSLCSPHALYCLKWRALAWCYCMPPGPLGADWWLNATHTSQLPSGMGRRRLADCKCHLTITQRAREDWGVCEELQGPTFDWYIQGSQVYKQIIFFPPSCHCSVSRIVLLLLSTSFKSLSLSPLFPNFNICIKTLPHVHIAGGL